MNKINIVLIGSGGHAISCVDVIEETKKFKIYGLLDNENKKKTIVLGKKKFKILTEKDLKKKKSINHLLIGFGSPKLLSRREKLFKKYKKLGYKFPTIVSPFAYLSKYSSLGEGTIVMHGAVINANTTIGSNCIINSKSLIEHDCIVKKNTHIATSVVINGHVEIQENCFIGSNSVIVQALKIRKGAFIKANSLIKKNYE